MLTGRFNLEHMRPVWSSVLTTAATSFLKGSLETKGFLSLVYVAILKLGTEYFVCFPFYVNANSAICSVQPRFVAPCQHHLSGREKKCKTASLPFLVKVCKFMVDYIDPFYPSLKPTCLV